MSSCSQDSTSVAVASLQMVAMKAAICTLCMYKKGTEDWAQCFWALQSLLTLRHVHKQDNTGK